MTRDHAIDRATGAFDSGAFAKDLARRVAMPTESQNPDRAGTLIDYLDAEIAPTLEALGFTCHTLAHGQWPFLVAERIEDAGLPTVLGYGHGDVIRGLDDGWADGLAPWRLTERDGRWYGRGVADNKGQHSITIAALQAVLETRGRLGFNAKLLIEMGEEVGSPGLREIAAANADLLAADVLLASDGPRLSAARPTVFLGSRGALSFDLVVDARDGGHHSGNWGGLLSDPAIRLVNAIAAVAGPTGRILVPEWLPPSLPDSVHRALADCEIAPGAGEPEIDPAWGEPGLTPAEKVYGWSSFAVLAIEAGNPKTPVNAIAPRAWARCQLRFVAGVDEGDILPALRRHLDRAGFADVAVAPAGDAMFRASMLDPDAPWAQWAKASIARTTGAAPAVIPSFGGALPNDVFADILGMPTVWVPHSYPGCSQHAPNEHVPLAVVREGLAIMAGLYWDLGEPGTP